MGIKSGFWLLLGSIAAAQTVAPSNSSADLLSPITSPQFYINATSSLTFPGFLIAPLGGYSVISRSDFLNLIIDGNIIDTDTTNANSVQPSDFNMVSCDPEDYEGQNLQPGDLLRIITNQQPSRSNGDTSTLIFYSTRSNHCNATDFSWLPAIQGVFTTLDPVVAAAVVGMNFSRASPGPAALTGDPATFTKGQVNSTGSYPQPTTAIAMIILYSITGIITALFVVIIITGAVRAHRHPERYGPRNTPGAPRQSRAKGIARAMLETIPIVKFGDSHDTTKNKSSTGDAIELEANNPRTAETTKSGAKSTTVTTTAIPAEAESSKAQSHRQSTSSKNADGTDDSGTLGCSICTEDFQKGEEVRVLPCNHKFHPDCVDPWLLNVSGTCPLCRIVLAEDAAAAEGAAGAEGTEGNIAPPLAVGPFTDRRSQAIHNLMAIAYGSRDERVTALRQYRAERRQRTGENITNEARMSRARAFREVFRIRTRRHENETAEVEQLRTSGLEAISGGQMRF